MKELPCRAHQTNDVKRKLWSRKMELSTYLPVLTHGLSALLLEQSVVSKRLKRGGYEKRELEIMR
jgi:hypothetical protein